MIRTAWPALRATVLTFPGLKPLTERASCASSLLRAAAAVSGADAARLSMRIVLSLSVKETAPPALRRAQPSGTLTLKPPPGGGEGDVGLVVGDVARPG